MKHLYITLLLLLFFNPGFEPDIVINKTKNVEFLKYVKEDDFSYWKIIKSSSIKNHEVNFKNRISIVSEHLPELDRLLYKNKNKYNLPAFYLKKDDEIVLINQLNFNKLERFIEKSIVNEAREFNSKHKVYSKKIKTKKGWNILEFKRDSICLIKLKMTIGFFNKNTESIKLLGNYDNEIEVYYLVW